jgi:hypothetical protein
MPATSSSASAEPAMAFQFVNLQDPSDSKDENVRRSIRSFVTKQQHQKADKMIAARRSNSDSQLQATSNPIPSEQQRSVSPGSTSDAALSASSPTQATMIDVSRVYPVQWLPYLNQILENCQSPNTFSQEAPTTDSFPTHCRSHLYRQRNTTIRRRTYNESSPSRMDALCHDRHGTPPLGPPLGRLALPLLQTRTSPSRRPLATQRHGHPSHERLALNQRLDDRDHGHHGTIRSLLARWQCPVHAYEWIEPVCRHAWRSCHVGLEWLFGENVGCY